MDVERTDCRMAQKTRYSSKEKRNAGSTYFQGPLKTESENCSF
jgi:hypothetical protein